MISIDITALSPFLIVISIILQVLLVFITSFGPNRVFNKRTDAAQTLELARNGHIPADHPLVVKASKSLTGSMTTFRIAAAIKRHGTYIAISTICPIFWLALLSFSLYLNTITPFQFATISIAIITIFALYVTIPVLISETFYLRRNRSRKVDAAYDTNQGSSPFIDLTPQ